MDNIFVEEHLDIEFIVCKDKEILSLFSLWLVICMDVKQGWLLRIFFKFIFLYIF